MLEHESREYLTYSIITYNYLLFMRKFFMIYPQPLKRDKYYFIN